MKISRKPNKTLDNKTRKVSIINDEIKNIVTDMIKTKDENGAVGLAANQVGIDYRIAVIGYKPKDDKDRSVPEITLINPRITYRSDDTSIQSERCLSVKDRDIDVPRSKKIHITYTDIDGKKKKLRARGILARIIQHEIDHLDGKTITCYS